MFRISRVIRYGIPRNAEEASVVMFGIVGWLIVLLVVERVCEMVARWVA